MPVLTGRDIVRFLSDNFRVLDHYERFCVETHDQFRETLKRQSKSKRPGYRELRRAAQSGPEEYWRVEAALNGARLLDGFLESPQTAGRP